MSQVRPLFPMKVNFCGEGHGHTDDKQAFNKQQPMVSAWKTASRWGSRDQPKGYSILRIGKICFLG